MIRITKNPEAFERLRTQNKALRITGGDLHGPVLVRLGQVHRDQMRKVFTSEGAEGAAGRWPALSPVYEERKRKVLGQKKMLVLTGRTRARLTVKNSPYYIQRYLSRSDTSGVYQFGALSSVAAAHQHGLPGLAQGKTSAASLVFGGTAPRLPVRDMIMKTTMQMSQLQLRVLQWYTDERIPQVLRAVKKATG